ncbi:2'-5' RNA ligase family protein [Falsiroseomonas sp. HW251]|uniref:2'-5' RNA ligase family protein n=1 Tax=Falsiroseomonas sp. HW251 TaxID=3390998 RepID=UPI003D312D41
MPVAVTLRLDDAAAARIESLRLAARDPADPPHHGYPAHLTLAVLADDALPAVEATLPRIIAPWRRLPLTIAGLGVFPMPTPVLWAAPVVTPPLLAAQEALCTALAGFALDPHYRPGDWVPHVTLQQGGSSSATAALGRASSVWDGPISGWLDRVELVSFHPVRVVGSHGLRG